MLLHVARALAMPAFILFAAVAPGARAASPDAAAGARLAAAGVPPAVPACASCHGARGEGLAAFPHLAGTGADYLREQLESFAAGTRKNPVMQPIAQALSAQQRAEGAAYYASLPPVTTKAADPEPRNAADLGPWLATRGRWSEGVPACAQCHGPGGIGVGTAFPPLAGQPAAYLSAQLKAWQGGTRPPGPLGLMEAIARKLQEADIQALATYYAGIATLPADTTARKGTP